MDTYDRNNCPVMRTADVVGDRWSILILREFFLEGPRRFQDLQDELNVSPNTLSGRLKTLEQAGVLSRRAYSTNPPRSEYVLTDAGKALGPLIQAFRDWGESFGNSD
ncbi:winged helix-turn-helix transcriptional regulator [Roseovarius phycicola]|uniref:Helix-turn-helix domain-containing protein n=1 Tax=Roseovarius phycicola TaxID=3080976 RepID=A0ABZ2HMH1_9RHOB